MATPKAQLLIPLTTFDDFFRSGASYPADWEICDVLMNYGRQSVLIMFESNNFPKREPGLQVLQLAYDAESRTISRWDQAPGG